MKFLVIIILFLVFHTPVNAKSKKLIYKVIKENTNIRIDSTVMSAVIGVLNKDEYIEVIEERFDWYKVRLPKRFHAYVSADYIKELDNKKVMVTASNLNLRNEPSLEAKIIGRAKNNDILDIIDKKDGWVKIYAYPYAYGWVHKNFLKKIGGKILIKEGIILPFKKDNCKVNSILKNGEKVPLLLINKNHKKFMNKKVKITGIKISNGCNYLLVKELRFKK